MTTSLAQQLNALKVQQRDALSVPKRVRISFLFDSKQAANIDDQTLFYIMRGGCQQLKQEGLLDLAAFESDLLNEKSLTYYRGQETKDQNALVDEQVGALLKALAPFLIEQPALKVVEYLIRIYEVHIYHKQTLLLAFMPLFETVYFLRITQCLSLKDDQVWSFLTDFAYQGQSISRQTLVKCLIRQNGLVFTMCADFCLEVGGALHTKWFGVFLSELLKSEKASDTLMFSVLPHINTALKQTESRELRIGVLLALCQISARKELSSEYCKAFLSAVVKSIGDQFEFDEDLKLKAFTTVLMFCQNQKVRLDKKQIQLLVKVPKVARVLSALSEKFDCSAFCQAVLESEASIDQMEVLLKSILTLKSTYLAVQQLIRVGCSEQAQASGAKEKLDLINKLQPEHYKQSTIFILKQITSSQVKEQIITLLGGQECSFGQGEAREFGILAGLGSQIQQNRKAALQKLAQQKFVQSLNQKEKELSHLMLLQLLSQQGQDQDTVTLLLAAIQNFNSVMSDIDFTTLLQLFDKVEASVLTYSKETLHSLVKIMAVVPVENKQNQIVQAWLAFQFKAELLAQNPFRELVQSLEHLQRNALQNIDFITGLISEPHSIDYALIASVLQKIPKDQALLEPLWYPIANSLRTKVYPKAQSLLSSLLPSSDYKLQKLFLQATLYQKQNQTDKIDLTSLHKKLMSKPKLFCELVIRAATESKCTLLKNFCCQTLVAMHTKGKSQLYVTLPLKYMITIVLMLINDKDRFVREQTLLLIDAILSQQGKKDHSVELVEVFTKEGDSVSPAKSKLTPMKTKSAHALLQDLQQARADILADQSQLTTVLTAHQRPEVYEEILRTIHDLPSFKMRQKLVEVLTQPQRHPMIFCLNLAQNLTKLLQPLGQQEPTEQYLSAIAALINQLQELSVKSARQQIVISLTIPFCSYLIDHKLVASKVYQIFETNLLHPDEKTVREVFKLYIKAQYVGPKLANLFVQRMQSQLSGEDLAHCFALDERTLETILAVQPPQSNRLFEKALENLQVVLKRFESGEEQAYLIELCCQVVNQATPVKGSDGSVIKQLEEMMELVWLKTKTVVKEGLVQELERQDNPFDQFMKEEKDDEEMSSESDNNKVDLIQCLQVTVSLMNLLTRFEASQQSVKVTTSYLNKIADFMLEVCKESERNQSAIRSQMYHLYQSLLLRTTKQQVDGVISPFASIISKFIQVSVKLCSFGLYQQLIEQNLVLNTLKQVPDYSSLHLFVLLWEASHTKTELTSQFLIKSDSNPALLLAQQLLLWQLDLDQDLQSLEELCYICHSIVLKSEAKEMIEEFSQLIESQPSHLQSCLNFAEGSVEVKRKFLYLTTLSLTNWATKDKQFVKILAQVAGTETPQPSVFKQLLNMQISSFILQQQLSLLLQSDNSDAFIRLQSTLKQWQTCVNDMTSLHLHLQMTMQVLEMEPLQLKNNFVSLLLQKISTFSSNWVAKSTPDVHRLTQKLLEQVLTILKTKVDENLSLLLLALVAKTCSLSLPSEVQLNSLKVVQKYHKGKNLQLQAQALLTETALMEVYGFAQLAEFHPYLQHVLAGFKVTEQAYFDVYSHALLKAVICVNTLFLKFLTADQLEEILVYTIKAEVKFEQEVAQALEAVCGEAVAQKKLILQAVMNVYGQIVALQKEQQFNLWCERYFEQILTPVIRRLPQSFISEHQEKFVLFFKQMYVLPTQVPTTTPLLVTCFNAFILKLNEEVLRPIIASLTKWSHKATSRKLVFYHLLEGCLDTLREFFVPLSKIYLNQCVDSIIAQYRALQGREPTKKRTHSEATLEEGNLDLLVKACKVVELNYKHDNSGFLQSDSFELLAEPVASLFELHTVDNFLTVFLPNTLQPLVYEMDERTDDDSMWQKLNYAMLMKTRSEHWQVRFAVLQVIDHLFDKMRERFLVVLNDTIPFISELLEDENERVEMCAKQIVGRIEQLTGESINEYLK